MAVLVILAAIGIIAWKVHCVQATERQKLESMFEHMLDEQARMNWATLDAFKAMFNAPYITPQVDSWPNYRKRGTERWEE